MTVWPRNDAPIAYNVTLSTVEDAPISFTLSSEDRDGDALAFNLLAPAARIFEGSLPNLTYTPATNFNGSDTITFQVADGQTSSAPATVLFTVLPVNDPPKLIVPDNQIVGNDLSASVRSDRLIALSDAMREAAASTFAFCFERPGNLECDNGLTWIAGFNGYIPRHPCAVGLERSQRGVGNLTYRGRKQFRGFGHAYRGSG